MRVAARASRVGRLAVQNAQTPEYSTSLTVSNCSKKDVVGQRLWAGVPTSRFPKRHLSTARPTSSSSTWATSMRSHSCAEAFATSSASTKAIGREVTLCGWVERFRPVSRTLAFVRLRDRTGTAQLRVEDEGTIERLKALGASAREAVVRVHGSVVARPEKDARGLLPADFLEVSAQDVSILNSCTAAPLPFDVSLPVESELSPDAERSRLQRRYLDLRRRELQHNIAFRSRFTHAARSFLQAHEFLDIETPTLFKRTVESGAQEFLVPTRNAGKFYALPQSPQQYKQLLMVAGFDRYFQIARCYRDEGMRADRQPEFTQIDLEMSFVEPDDVMSVVEGLLRNVINEVVGVSVPAQFERMSHAKAMDLYGMDKPDTRFEMLLQDVSPELTGPDANISVDLFRTNTLVKCVRAPGLVSSGGKLSRRELQQLKEAATAAHGDSLVIQLLPENGNAGACDWVSPISKSLDQSSRDAIQAATAAVPGDVLVFALGFDGDSVLERNKVNSVLGRSRLKLAELMRVRGHMPAVDPRQFNFLWVVDFPLFEMSDDGVVESSHHPFTDPIASDLDLLQSSDVEDLLRVRGKHYDIVLNGAEVGGGSIRIHRPEVQQRVCELLDPSGSMLEQFGHLFEALRCGAPPHGGIALGLDRLVAMLCNASSLREVIAFPKTGSGSELMTGAPAPVSQEVLQEFGLATTVDETD